ncbi:unnamed protein product [Clavelina lepadiformis]|uniref:Protein Smaug n=1 Tax=Clavelina lepadiformis TaxID=159417 RepID=A0ABP0FJ16_CLALP
MLFRDQVEVLATWFKNWNECEQTVALCSLLKRVKKCQAKFLARCLEHFLNDCGELLPLEEEANNPDYVKRLFTNPYSSEVIDILLSHLPLLRPGNDVAKNHYLEILPTVLGHAIEQSEYLEESRQLLSYSLIHPAFDNKERHLLTSWMAGLDGRVAPDNHIPSSPGETSPENNSTTNSLEIGASLNDWHQNTLNDESSHSKDCGGQYDTISSTASSTEQQSNSTENATDGMADVKIWLKSLRLHKYADLFSHMTYEEMMELKPDMLDAQNVTKGARNKIILSIKKLHERFKQLQSLENEILGGGSLRSALLELKMIIQTPIKKFESPPLEEGVVLKRDVIEEGDIPALYTKVMGKACTQLLVSKPDEENITLYMKLLERCLQHPAFPEAQKRRLRSWKQQVSKMYHSLPRNSRTSAAQRPIQQGVGYPGLRKGLGKSSRFPPHLTSGSRSSNPLASPPMRAVGMFQPQNQMTWYANTNSLSASSTPIALDSVRKASSLDPRLGQRMFADNEGENPSSEITNRLDSLCLSVAEHALADGMDGISTL